MKGIATCTNGNNCSPATSKPNGGPAGSATSPPQTAAVRLAALQNLRLPDTLTDMLDLAVHMSIKPPDLGGGYTYAIDVEVTGGLRPPDPLLACDAPTWIAVECVHGNQTGKPVRCRRCTSCKNAWRHKVRALILDGSKGGPVYMWTLTFHEYVYQMKGDRFDFAQRAWAKLRRKAVRRHVTMQYLRVVELQRRGTPHFHLALSGWRHRGVLLERTSEIFRQALSLALASGFGPQMDLSRARLGPAGVASYLSKYLEKSEDYNLMNREDGRAIRRYNRSRGWGFHLDPPSWRYRAVPNSYTHTQLPDYELHCICGQNQLLARRHHASAWIRRSYANGAWVAPLSILDYIIKENLTWDEQQNTLVPGQLPTTRPNA